MSNTPSTEQLNEVVRVLTNTDTLLKNGLFPGANAKALLEAQGYIYSLLQQTKQALNVTPEVPVEPKGEE